MGGSGRAWNLTCDGQRVESCKKGTREISESSRKQDGNAMQEKGTRMDKE